MTIENEAIIKGVVVKVADYGAIVRLAGGKMGLIHISEIADSYVRDVRDYVKEDDEVTVKVLRLNVKGRYELSLKQCDGQVEQEREPRPALAVASRPSGHSEPRYPAKEEQPPKQPITFEDRLSKFMKDSEERQHDLKRHLEGKRGRR